MPTLALTKAPTEAKNFDVSWFEINNLDLLLAAAIPKVEVPLPTIIILHGSHGFAKEYIQLALDLSKYGFLAFAVRWFKGSAGLGSKFVTPIISESTKELPDASGEETIKIIDTIYNTISKFEYVDNKKIGIFGHSRGARAAINYSIKVGKAKAVVANSAGYPEHFLLDSKQMKPPLLILHGMKDDPSEGGTEVTNVKMAMNFENELKKHNSCVISKYYESGGHNSFFTDRAQYVDGVELISEFFKNKLN